MNKNLRYPKVGDRVAVYCCSRSLNGARGTVKEYDGQIIAYVQLDQYALHQLDAIQPFHIGQLRRLKKKLRKSVWVGLNLDGGAVTVKNFKPTMDMHCWPDAHRWVEFIEVRRK